MHEFLEDIADTLAAPPFQVTAKADLLRNAEPIQTRARIRDSQKDGSRRVANLILELLLLRVLLRPLILLLRGEQPMCSGYLPSRFLLRNVVGSFDKCKRETAQTHCRGCASVLNAGRAGSRPHSSQPAQLAGFPFWRRQQLE